MDGFSRYFLRCQGLPRPLSAPVQRVFASAFQTRTPFRVERVYPNGVISVTGTPWYLSNCLAGELVGLEPIDDASWTVHFGPIQLGVLDGRAKDRGMRHFGRLVRIDGVVRRRRRHRRR